MTDEKLQAAFDTFFKTHPRFRRTQRNINLLSGYLEQIGKPFQYSAELLDEGYRVLASSLDLLSLPAVKTEPPPPVPEPEPSAPSGAASTIYWHNGVEEVETAPRHANGWIAARQDGDLQAMQNLVQLRRASRDFVQNAPESANPRQAELNEAGRKNLDQISQAARDRLKARGRG